MDGATSGGGVVVVLCIATHDQLTMEATPSSPSGSVWWPPPSSKPHLLQLFHSKNPLQTVAPREIFREIQVLPNPTIHYTRSQQNPLKRKQAKNWS